MSRRLLEAMRRNPVGDWSMADVEKLCSGFGIVCAPPSGGGSHYKVSRTGSRLILTIPARRPVKAVYIRKLVAFVDEHGDMP